jgi:hypothetical protein
VEPKLYKDPPFTPLRVENAQSVSSSSLITAPEGGVLNERRCKKWKIKIDYTFEELKWHTFSEANAFYSFKVMPISLLR